MEQSNPRELFNSLQYGFSQVTVARGSRIVSVSGQVAWNAAQTLEGGESLYAETCKALENLQTALASVQATLADVISLRIYIVDYQPQDADQISQALKMFFPPEQAPAATWVGVASLANPTFRIEIEAMAVMA